MKILNDKGNATEFMEIANNAINSIDIDAILNYVLVEMRALAEKGFYKASVLNCLEDTILRTCSNEIKIIVVDKIICELQKRNFQIIVLDQGFKPYWKVEAIWSKEAHKGALAIIP